MATDEEILSRIEQNNSERQLLDLEIEGRRYGRLRSVSRIQPARVQPRRKPKVSSTDSIIFPGIKGKLGSRVLEVAEEVELNNWDNKCISYLSRNGIIDFSNKSQLKLIGITLNKLRGRFNVEIEEVTRDIDSLNTLAKTARNHTAALKVLRDIELFKYTNAYERAIKMIYIHILDQVVNKPVLFTPLAQKKFSEMSLLAKFWAPVLELFFDPNNYFLQWGDTTSPNLSMQHINFNLDFRIIIQDINAESLDITTGEVSRDLSITPHKLYRDFLKSALTTKVHLNDGLKKAPYIPPLAIKRFIFPFIQIMGLTCNVYSMSILDKKVYSIQKLVSVNYPSTNREIQNGGVRKLINAFALVESMIMNINEMITEYSKPISTKMDRIKGNRKRRESQIDIAEYISAVRSYSEVSEDEIDYGTDDEE